MEKSLLEIFEELPMEDQLKLVRSVFERIGKPQISNECSPKELLEVFRSHLESCVKAENRMAATMATVAKGLGLRWTKKPPSGHPYGAQLDGQILRDGSLLAVVELEREVGKQIRSALLDLMTHPAARKILVIGSSRKFGDPAKLRKDILERVLPAIQSKLVTASNIGVFTERELREDPGALGRFLGV